MEGLSTCTSTRFSLDNCAEITKITSNTLAEDNELLIKFSCCWRERWQGEEERERANVAKSMYIQGVNHRKWCLAAHCRNLLIFDALGMRVGRMWWWWCITGVREDFFVKKSLNGGAQCSIDIRSLLCNGEDWVVQGSAQGLSCFWCCSGKQRKGPRTREVTIQLETKRTFIKTSTRVFKWPKRKVRKVALLLDNEDESFCNLFSLLKHHWLIGRSKSSSWKFYAGKSLVQLPVGFIALLRHFHSIFLEDQSTFLLFSIHPSQPKPRIILWYTRRFWNNLNEPANVTNSDASCQRHPLKCWLRAKFNEMQAEKDIVELHELIEFCVEIAEK